MTSLSKRPPVYKQKSHGIEVAVWKREHEDKAFYSVSATRSYRDSDGNWKTSGSFNLEDRDILMDYLDRAFRDAQARLDADREQRRLEDAKARPLRFAILIGVTRFTVLSAGSISARSSCVNAATGAGTVLLAARATSPSFITLRNTFCALAKSLLRKAQWNRKLG